MASCCCSWELSWIILRIFLLVFGYRPIWPKRQGLKFSRLIQHLFHVPLIPICYAFDFMSSPNTIIKLSLWSMELLIAIRENQRVLAIWRLSDIPSIQQLSKVVRSWVMNHIKSNFFILFFFHWQFSETFRNPYGRRL